MAIKVSEAIAPLTRVDVVAERRMSGVGAVIAESIFRFFCSRGLGLTMEQGVVFRAGAGHDYRFMGFFILRVIERRRILRAARSVLTIAYVRMQGYVSKADESAAL